MPSSLNFAAKRKAASIVDAWKLIVPKKKPHANSYKAWDQDKAAMSRWYQALPTVMAEFKRLGWGEDQLPYLFELWMRESRWNPSAANPTSSARGIAQAMTGTHFQGQPEKLKKYLTDPTYQIKWGLEYIKRRKELGTPEAAVKAHNRKNWY